MKGKRDPRSLNPLKEAVPTTAQIQMRVTPRSQKPVCPASTSRRTETNLLDSEAYG